MEGTTGHKSAASTQARQVSMLAGMQEQLANFCGWSNMSMHMGVYISVLHCSDCLQQ